MKRKLLLALLVVAMLFTASCSSQFKIKFSQGTTTTLVTTESLLPNDQDLKSGFYSIEKLDQITALHREDPNVCNLDSHLHLSQDTLQKIVASLGVQLQDNFVQCRFSSYILNVTSNEWMSCESVKKLFSDGWPKDVTMSITIIYRFPEDDYFSYSMPYDTFCNLDEFNTDFKEVVLREETVNKVTTAVKIGNANYYMERLFHGINTFEFVTQYARIQVRVSQRLVSESGTSFENLYPDNEIFRNLLNANTAEKQINDLIQEWEAILGQDASKFGSKWTKDD